MPDGTRVIFGTPSSPGDFPPFTSSIVAADGTGRPRPFAQHLVSSVSPDGQTLALQARDPETGWDIWLQRADQSEEPRALFRTEAQFEVHPQFSPDGRFLVYASDETGRIEVYVTTMPEGEGKWQVSVEGGGAPRWSPRGVTVDEVKVTALEEAIFLGEGERLRISLVVVGDETMTALHTESHDDPTGFMARSGLTGENLMEVPLTR